MSKRLNNGSIRVAKNRQPWNDFTLNPGCAFGRDHDGYLFASFGVPAKRYGLEGAKDGYIVVFRADDYASAGNMQGSLALMLAGRKAHGYYHADFETGKSAYVSLLHDENMVWNYNGRSYVNDRRYTKNPAWKIRWRVTQIPANEGLGLKICQKIHAYKAQNHDTAQKEYDRRYAGLASTFGKYK